jgi:hypothetical protein
VLKNAYGHADDRCACRGIGPKRLALKYYEFGNSYALAKFALTGDEHVGDCQFHSAGDGAAGAGGSGAGVLDVQADGSVRIELEIDMNVREGVEPAPEPGAKPSRSGSTRQSAIKLAGPLYYLWPADTINH